MRPKSKRHLKPRPQNSASKSARWCIRPASPSPAAISARASIIFSKSSAKERCWSELIARCPHSKIIAAPLSDLTSRPEVAINLLLSFFRPRIFQRDRAVPHLFLRHGIGVEREISKPLKLIPFFRTRVRELGLAFRRHHFERMRIYERFEIAGSVGFGNSEQPIIQSDFRISPVRGADPVYRPFDFAFGRCPP